MSARAVIEIVRFAAATYIELHRVCARWWAEEIDRAAGRNR